MDRSGCPCTRTLLRIISRQSEAFGSNHKKVERQQKGENVMSKLISELVQKECKIKTEDAIQLVGDTELLCHVLDADDEWIKVSFTDKKKNQITKLLRIENISEVEIIENDIQ